MFTDRYFMFDYYLTFKNNVLFFSFFFISNLKAIGSELVVSVQLCSIYFASETFPIKSRQFCCTSSSTLRCKNVIFTEQRGLSISRWLYLFGCSSFNFDSIFIIIFLANEQLSVLISGAGVWMLKILLWAYSQLAYNYLQLLKTCYNLFTVCFQLAYKLLATC